MQWLSLLLIVLLARAEGCTAFQLEAKDGAHIYCRSMEFTFPLHSELLIVPRGTRWTATAPEGKEGISWTTKYGYVGMNQSLERRVVSDGMNEKGLVAACLYMRGYTRYEPPNPNRLDRTLAAWELPNFLLATCANVEEVKAVLPTLLVADQSVPNMGTFIPPLHFYICDQTAAVLIVEYVGGVLRMHDNPLGVLTNAPTFAWHMDNLANYINLSANNAAPLDLHGFEVKSFTQGSGLHGLPGDYTSPSRFVRATLFSQWAIPQQRAIDAVCMGFHILNTFDLFEGIIRSGKTLDTTQWVVVHDRTNLQTFFRSYESMQVQRIDLKSIDFAQPGLRQIPMQREFLPQEVKVPS